MAQLIYGPQPCVLCDIQQHPFEVQLNGVRANLSAEPGPNLPIESTGSI